MPSGPPKERPAEASPGFASSYFYHQESASGALTLTFQQPGVYYYGATPSWQGRAAQCTAGGEYGSATAPAATRPVALVVAGR